ncbi:MAG: hypothetical protein AAB473_01700 [Patescibacteria group bacterium]
MLKFLRFALASPFFLIPTCLVVGAFVSATDPDLAQILSAQAFKLLTPEVGPVVFQYAVYVLLAFAGFDVGWYLSGASAHAECREELEPLSGELFDELPDADAQLEVEEYSVWAEARMNPWRSLLEDVDESGLVGDIGSLFFPGEKESRDHAAHRQDIVMMLWLVGQAERFARQESADPAGNSRKIFRFLEQAFRVAGERNAWSVMRINPGSEIVLVPFFLDQERGLTGTWGGSHDHTGAFTEFATWAASTTIPPSGASAGP